MREAYISVPLPGEHFSPNVRLILHNRGGAEDPVSFVSFLFGEKDEIDPVEGILVVPYMRDILAQRTTARVKGDDGKWRRMQTTVRTLVEQGLLRCVHLCDPITVEDVERSRLTHVWRLRYRTDEGMKTADFNTKLSNDELKTFFKENGVLPFTRNLRDPKKPKERFPRLRETPVRPWGLEPIAFNFLKRLAFRECRTDPLKARQHGHNLRHGDRFLAIVGPEVRSATVAGIQPVAVVIVDVEAGFLAVMDLDFFVRISRGRKAVVESASWKSWYAENSDPVSPTVEEPEDESSNDTDEEEEDEEGDDGPGLAMPIAAHLAAKTPTH